MYAEGYIPHNGPIVAGRRPKKLTEKQKEEYRLQREEEKKIMELDRQEYFKRELAEQEQRINSMLTTIQKHPLVQEFFQLQRDKLNNK